MGIITKAQFARLAGVSGAAITKAVDTPRLDRAVVGKRIDTSHPDAIAYLATRRMATSKVVVQPLDSPPPPPPPQSPPPPPPPPQSVNRPPHARGAGAKKEKKKRSGAIGSGAELPVEIYDILDLTFREILDRYGTESRFVDVLSAGQKVESIKSSRVKTAQHEGKLISRTLVQNGVIDVFNSAHLRLMKDGAKSIAAGAISKHSSGASATEVEAYVSDILGSFIKPVKSKIVRTLKNA